MGISFRFLRRDNRTLHDLGEFPAAVRAKVLLRVNSPKLSAVQRISRKLDLLPT